MYPFPILSGRQALVAASIGFTLNPADKNSSLTLSNSNKTATHIGSGSTHAAVRGTIGKSSGLWYFEAVATLSASGFVAVGIANSSEPLTVLPGSAGDTGNNGTSFYSAGGIYNNGGNVIVTSFASGDVIGVMCNTATGDVSFYQNNALIGSTTIASAGPYYPILDCVSLSSATPTVTLTLTPVYTPPGGATVWA